MSTSEATHLVGAVLAGERGDADRCVGSLVRFGIRVEVFDTTEDQRQARLTQAGVTVTPLAWLDSFADARNRALDVLRATGDASSVLWLDTDERLVKRPDDRLLRSLRIGEAGSAVFCPSIRDARLEVQGVGRLHSLRTATKFVGLVHEYLTDRDGGCLVYRPCEALIEHDGYDSWSRTERNKRLLELQVVTDSENPRWWAFLVRDAGSVLPPLELTRAIRAFAALCPYSDVIGGITPADYTRMTAWHGAWNLVCKGGAAMVEPALRRLRVRGDDDLLSEILYLRLVASVISGSGVADLLEEAFECRRRSIALGREQPWLDAGISVGLESEGRRGEANAYRAESRPFTDPFCVDSELRPEFRPAQQSALGGPGKVSRLRGATRWRSPELP